MEADREENFFEEASRRLMIFEEQISTWNPKSKLSQFNQTSNVWFPFDQDTYNSLKRSLSCSKLTNGYFHPGLGRLIQLWGMRDQLKIPSPKNIAATLKHSDLSKVEFNDAGFLVRKTNKHFWFEEGGFAKGAAMDNIVKQARKVVGKDLYLNFSGQVFSEKKRSVGIANPTKRDSIAVFVEIEKESMSTSGIGVQHFKHQNKIYGHIINPQTGFPVAHALKSVTVIHSENYWADCLSTGLLVMSENKTEFKNWLSANPEIKVVLLEKKDGKLTAETSCNLKNKIRTTEQFSQINENC